MAKAKSVSPGSIRALAPLEKGGSVSRGGFTYQDHVAVSFCLKMLEEPKLMEVWCETHDDITLIWDGSTHEEVEFVQVKDVNFGHFWSVAELCKREKTPANASGVGTSIIERSLRHDRCSEPCHFCIITSLPVDKSLEILTYPTSALLRCSPNKDLDSLANDIDKRIPGFVSDNKHDTSFWLKNAQWKIEHDEESVKRKNIELLEKQLDCMGIRIPLEQIRNKVYPPVLQKVQDAANAEWEIDPEQKQIKRLDFGSWLEKTVRAIQYSDPLNAGEKMQEKMNRVFIPADYILTAIDARIYYRQQVLAPRYLDLADVSLIQNEVAASLARLRLRLDAGEIPEGFSFYKTCLEKMNEVRSSLPLKEEPTQSFVDGCMHDIADRCGHRYHKETV